MKKIFKIITVALLLSCNMINTYAQSAAVQKVSKSVFTLTTFKSNGTMIDSSHGVFIGTDGEAISNWKPFVGADSAIVVDANGNRMVVDAIYGANELYDVCKFRVNGKTIPASIATTPASQGSKAWLVGYSIQKPEIKEMTINKVEKFLDKYSYYIFSETVPSNTNNCPFVNQNGQVIGLLQLSSTSTDIHATDAKYMSDFSVTNGLQVNDPVLRQTRIRMVMPNDEKQALILLMMTDNLGFKKNYSKYVDDYVKLFPTSVEGYKALAQQQIMEKKFSAADATMETALQKVNNKDEAHYEFSRLIYNKLIYSDDSTFTKWTLDKALSEVQQANAIKANPSYRHQEAQILFSKKEYQKALDIFTELTKTSINSAELYFESAQCKTQLKAPQSEILALLDSAVAACPRPLTNLAAPYIFARGNALDNAGEYRKAISDYNQYDTLMLGRATPEFYYIKYKCETKIRQFQQALNDIAHAVVLSPREPTYYAELASLQLRVNQFSDAIKTCDLCMSFAPNYSDVYIIKGIAQIQNKQKEEGLKTLQKAKELNDDRAQSLIDKYK